MFHFGVLFSLLELLHIDQVVRYFVLLLNCSWKVDSILLQLLQRRYFELLLNSHQECLEFTLGKWVFVCLDQGFLELTLAGCCLPKLVKLRIVWRLLKWIQKFNMFLPLFPLIMRHLLLQHIFVPRTLFRNRCLNQRIIVQGFCWLHQRLKLPMDFLLTDKWLVVVVG